MPQAVAVEPVLLVTFDQAARMLGVSQSTVRRLIENEKLAVVHLGRAVRIPREAVEQFAAELAQR
jgi:excisionase family DNA binding protein